MDKYFTNGKADNGFNEVERTLGMKAFRSKYHTNSIEEYVKFLENLNMAEIRSHCIETQQKVPRGDRKSVIRQLEKEFRKFKFQSEMKTEKKEPTGDIPNEVRRMLNI